MKKPRDINIHLSRWLALKASWYFFKSFLFGNGVYFKNMICHEMDEMDESYKKVSDDYKILLESVQKKNSVNSYLELKAYFDKRDEEK